MAAIWWSSQYPFTPGLPEFQCEGLLSQVLSLPGPSGTGRDLLVFNLLLALGMAWAYVILN